MIKYHPHILMLRFDFYLIILIKTTCKTTNSKRSALDDDLKRIILLRFLILYNYVATRYAI